MVRRLLVEGAWQHARPLRSKVKPRPGVPDAVRLHAEKGSRRMADRRSAMLDRGLCACKANAASAAEAARWLWAVGLMAQRCAVAEACGVAPVVLLQSATRRSAGWPRRPPGRPSRRPRSAAGRARSRCSPTRRPPAGAAGSAPSRPRCPRRGCRGTSWSRSRRSRPPGRRRSSSWRASRFRTR